MQDKVDPVSAASAALFAAGVSRTRRMAVLQLFGLLLDHADVSGRVHPREVLVAFGISPEGAMFDLALLETVGAVHPDLDRADGAWFIPGYEHHHAVAMPTGAGLEVLARFMNDPAAGLESAAGQPAGTRANVRPWLATAGVAAAVALVLGVLGAVILGRDAGTLRLATEVLTPGTPSPAPSGVDAPSDTTIGAPQGSGPGASPSAPSSSAATRPPPQGTTTTPVAPPCPSGGPVVQVQRVTVMPTAGLAPAWKVVVTGDVINQATAPVVVEVIDVVVDVWGAPVRTTVPGNTRAMAPGGRQFWRAEVPGGTLPPLAPSATGAVSAWSWAQPVSGCA